jgi:MFS family permease
MEKVAGMRASAAPATARALAPLITSLTTMSLLGTAALTILPTLAPVVAKTYSIPAVWIGYQFSLVSAFMAVSLLFLGKASRRWGPGRVIQTGAMLIGTGLVVVLIPTLYALLVASALMGLGYGLLMPANSHLMMRFTPRANLNLVFSIQQTGIPLGAILAASVAPAIALAASWQWAVGSLAVLVFAFVALVQAQRRDWDDDRDPAAVLLGNPFAGAAIVLRDARLRNLSISGFCFSGGQFCVATYTVVALVEDMGYGLVLAGMMLSVSQVAGIVCRLYCGWHADRTGDSITVLTWLAVVMAVFGIANLGMSEAWPLLLVCVLFAGHGAATVGWPGTYLAEVGRLCPPGQVSSGTSGSLLFTNAGKTLAPLAFAAVQAHTENYSIAFGLIGVLGIVGVIALLAARRAPQAPGPAT